MRREERGGRGWLTASPLERSFLLQVLWTQLKKRSQEIVRDHERKKSTSSQCSTVSPAWKFFSEGRSDGI
jgi:hypothetical protein